MFCLVRPGSILNLFGANWMDFRKLLNLPGIQSNLPTALSTLWYKNSEPQLEAYIVESKKNGHVNSQLELAREILHQFEIAQDHRVLSGLELWLRNKLKLHSLALSSLQRTIARSRSRITCLSEGDANTAMFHSFARYRKRKNFISKLTSDDGVVLTKHEEKEQNVFNFYSTLLVTSASHWQYCSSLGKPRDFKPTSKNAVSIPYNVWPRTEQSYFHTSHVRSLIFLASTWEFLSHLTSLLELKSNPS